MQGIKIFISMHIMLDLTGWLCHNAIQSTQPYAQRGRGMRFCSTSIYGARTKSARTMYICP
ncbi:hypothetical protein I7I48_07552 [Histoplasma ohiense]|nr:hypothetical protein I7I48_07552 [Histoplasma ohiense (nom. inval.)]